MHHKSHKGHHARSGLRHCCEDTDETNPDHSLILGDIAALVITIHIEAVLDHNTEIDMTTIGAVHDDLAQPTEDTATDLTMTLHTCHIADHPNIKTLQVINPMIVVDNIHDHPIDLQDMYHANQIHIPVGQEVNHIPRGT